MNMSFEEYRNCSKRSRSKDTDVRYDGIETNPGGGHDSDVKRQIT